MLQGNILMQCIAVRNMLSLDCKILNCILEVQMPSVSAFFSKMEVVIVRFQQLELCCLRLYADL